MQYRWPLIAQLVVVLGAAVCNSAIAGVFYFDDFSDGDVFDGTPFSWGASEEFGATPDVEVVDGDLVVSVNGIIGLMIPSFPILDFEDVSIRSQVSVTSSQTYIVKVATGNDETITRYAGGLREVPVNPAGWQTRVESDLLISGSINKEVGRSSDIPVNLNPRMQDVVLQLDVLDDEISFWAWNAGDAMPQEPLASFTDNQIALPKVGIEIEISDAPVDTVEMQVRYFAFSDTQIRGDNLNEAVGDFNYDGVVSGPDFLAWQRGESSEPFSQVDLNVWQYNFARTVETELPAGLQVPEPASLLLLLLAVFACPKILGRCHL